MPRTAASSPGCHSAASRLSSSDSIAGRAAGGASASCAAAGGPSARQLQAIPSSDGWPLTLKSAKSRPVQTRSVRPALGKTRLAAAAEHIDLLRHGGLGRNRLHRTPQRCPAAAPRLTRVQGAGGPQGFIEPAVVVAGQAAAQEELPQGQGRHEVCAERRLQPVRRERGRPQVLVRLLSSRLPGLGRRLSCLQMALHVRGRQRRGSGRECSACCVACSLSRHAQARTVERPQQRRLAPAV